MTSAIEALTRRYPTIDKTEVADLIAEAQQTVHRLTGHHDPDLAADLAQLRLDVRTRRAA